MNSLSLMLYVADVVPNISEGLVVISLLYFIVVFFISVFGDLSGCDETATMAAGMKKYLRFFAVAFVIGLLIPSQKTIYYILMSEVGEEAIKSDAAKKVLTAIEKRVDEYLKEGKDHD